jgi:hypothetical protein
MLPTTAIFFYISSAMLGAPASRISLPIAKVIIRLCERAQQRLMRL